MCATLTFIIRKHGVEFVYYIALKMVYRVTHQISDTNTRTLAFLLDSVAQYVYTCNEHITS